MNNIEKINQKYSARHLTPKSRVLFALSHKQLRDQLVVLKEVNRSSGYPGSDDQRKTFFRQSWSRNIGAL